MIQPGQILIVDDEPSLLRMMSVYLRRLGFQVVTASNAEQGLEAIHSQPEAFAIAVLDATMSGPKVDKLASDMFTIRPELRVIISSGYPVDMSLMEAESPGRVVFLHKPFAPEMLAAAVRRMLGTKEEI